MSNAIDVIYNEDCVVGMQRIDDASIDMTLTSPPYDNLRDYNGYSVNIDGVIKELYRVTKDGGVVVWIVGDATIKGSETGTSFRNALSFMDAGFNLHDTMIWSKDGCSFPDTNRYYQSFEYMFVFSKGKIGTFNAISDRKNKQGGVKIRGTERHRDGSLAKSTGEKHGLLVKTFGCRFNVWNFPSVKRNTTGHPAPFPEQLANDHIISWSNPGDTVLDPFMGSGTTGVAALKNHRHYIGFDVSSEYCEIARRRIG